MTDDTAIRVDGLWKRYGLPLPEIYYRGRRWLRSQRKKTDNAPDDDGPWALRDVSFDVKRGETLGIIGRNGAGKSTLLKVLAGVTPPTLGRVDVRGRVFPMIELNAGMHMELSGRENVYMLGAVMGMGRADVKTRMPAIEEFCELGEWFDRPVRTYSSGMLARLGFGVAVNIDADVLLVDEVLAVGDYDFRRRCFDRFSQLQQRGATILLVTHNMYQVQRLCSVAAFLERGRSRNIGEPVDVIARYESTVLTPKNAGGGMGGAHSGNGLIRVNLVRLLGAHGQPASVFAPGESIAVQLDYEVREPVEQPVFTIFISNLDNVLAAVLISSTYSKTVGQFAVPGTVTCEIPSLDLAPGTYTVDVKVGELDRLDFWRNASQFQIRPTAESTERSANLGFAYLHHFWTGSEYSQQEPRCGKAACANLDNNSAQGEGNTLAGRVVDVSAESRTVAGWQKAKPEPFSSRGTPFKRGPLDQIIEFLQDAGSVIDIGCGVGHTLKYLEEQGFGDLIGITMTPDEVANKVCNATMEIADIQEYSTDRVFDAAIMWDVLEHLAAPVVGLANVNKLLKLRGKLLLYVPPEDWIECDYHVIVPTERQTKWLLNLTGFHLEQSIPVQNGGTVYLSVKLGTGQLYRGTKA